MLSTFCNTSKAITIVQLRSSLTFCSPVMQYAQASTFTNDFKIIKFDNRPIHVLASSKQYIINHCSLKQSILNP